MNIYTYNFTHMLKPPEQGLPALKQMTVTDIEDVPVYNDGWLRKCDAIRVIENLTLFAVVHQKEILFADWMVTGNSVTFFRLGLSFPLPQSWAWEMSLFVHPKYRRKGVGTYYRKRVLWEMSGRGYTRMGTLSTNDVCDRFIESTGGVFFSAWTPEQAWPQVF